MSFGNSSLHLNATINRYIRGATAAIARKRILLAMLQSKGRVTNNMTGKLVDWKVKYKRSPMSPFTDGDVITFVRQDKHKTAQIPMRSYIVSQSINKGDKLMNSGKEAIVKLWDAAVNELIDDIRDQFCEQLLQVDGYATGSTNRIMGLESMFGGSTSATSLVATNSDTYAGLSTTRGNYGGSWTGSWPDGYGDSHYDFWSPLIVNYTSVWAASSGGWTSGTKTWPNTCIEAVRFAILNTQRNGDDLDFILLEKNLYRQLLDRAEDAERLVVNRNQDSAMTKLGFRGINIDGVDLFWEVGVPAGVGYGLCMDQMELMSWQDQLFKSNTDFNLESVSDRVAIDFYGNLRIKNPRCFAKFIDLD
jgi:hypothetical protein